MAALVCEICGGTLIGKPGGLFECEYCGVQYDTTWAKAKIQEIRGTVQVEGTVEVTGTVKVEGSANIESFLTRGKNALEDGRFIEAKTHFDKALDIDAECAEAYLGLAMAIRNERTVEELIAKNKTDSSYYKRAKQYATGELRKKIDSLEKEKLEYQNSQVKKIKEHRIRIKNAQNLLSASGCTTIGLKSDGTVLAVGSNKNGQSNVKEWTDIVAISAAYHHTIGLKADGTVVSTKYAGWPCKVDTWENIVAVDTCEKFTVGLKSDGTVIATDLEGGSYKDVCQINKWQGIIAIAAGDDVIIGLKSDGTVVASLYSDNYLQVYREKILIDEWTDIIAIAAGSDFTVGLKSDGTVVAAGRFYGEIDVSGWSDIVAIDTDSDSIFGLKSDGTVVATTNCLEEYYTGQCNIENWNNIIAISSGGTYTVGLKADGTVVATEYISDDEEDVEDFCQCNVVDNWKLFSDFNNIEEERKIKRKEKRNSVPAITLGEAISQNKSTELIQQILDAGADPNKIEERINEAGKKFKISMLSSAVVEAKSIEIIELLIKYGADPNKAVRINSAGEKYYALSDAIWNAKSPQIVKCLLQGGADANIIDEYTNQNGKPVRIPMLSHAIGDAKSIEMVDLLIRYGADPNKAVRKNPVGDINSALSDAIWNAKSVPMVKRLLEAGANPNRIEAIYDEGKHSNLSMLSFAILFAKNAEMVELLIKYGANWESIITFSGLTKMEKKYPYNRINGIPDDLIKVIKRLGWKGSLF